MQMLESIVYFFPPLRFFGACVDGALASGAGVAESDADAVSFGSMIVAGTRRRFARLTGGRGAGCSFLSLPPRWRKERMMEVRPPVSTLR